MHAIEIWNRSEYVPFKSLLTHNIILQYPFVSKFLSNIAGLAGQSWLARILKNFALRDINYFVELLVHRKSYIDEFEKKIKLEQIDAIILPTFATCAFKNEDAEELAFIESINLFVNFLGFCSGTFPVTVVKEGETFFEEPFHNDV